MSLQSPILGQKMEIGFSVKERTGESFTITAATITITDAADNVLRDAVDCVIDGKRVYYIETFSTDNGYAINSTYDVTINASITMSSSSYTEIFQDTVYVLDTVYVSLEKLINDIRVYIDDEGEAITRNLVGLADGTRTKFRLQNKNVDSDSLVIYVNGIANTAYTKSGDIITFTNAPALNAALVADYTCYSYADSILEICIRQAVSYLNDAAEIGWGEAYGDVWLKDASDLEISLVIMAALLEFTQMQMIRLPVTISFGDVGARISLRGATGDRQRVVKQMTETLNDRIMEYREMRITFSVIA